MKYVEARIKRKEELKEQAKQEALDYTIESMKRSHKKRYWK